MNARFFIDTNILIYAGSNALEDLPKKRIALKLLEEPDIAFSAQVLQEYYQAAVRKGRLRISDEEACTRLRLMMSCTVLPITGELVIRAAELRTKLQISYWDAAIIAAALELGCVTIFSEDLNDGQDYGGVIVRNPFTDK